MIMPIKDWRDDLVHFLITGGTVGRKQTEILARFQSRVKAAQLKGELEALWAEDKVQKFIVKETQGRGYTLWRATTKIRVKS